MSLCTTCQKYPATTLDDFGASVCGSCAAAASARVDAAHKTLSRRRGPMLFGTALMLLSLLSCPFARLGGKPLAIIVIGFFLLGLVTAIGGAIYFFATRSSQAR